MWSSHFFNSDYVYIVCLPHSVDSEGRSPKSPRRQRHFSGNFANTLQLLLIITLRVTTMITLVEGLSAHMHNNLHLNTAENIWCVTTV